MGNRWAWNLVSPQPLPRPSEVAEDLSLIRVMMAKGFRNNPFPNPQMKRWFSLYSTVSLCGAGCATLLVYFKSKHGL